MIELFSFFIVITAGLVLSEIFNKLHLPWVVALILAGILIGPNGLNWFSPNASLDFLSYIGLIFLMFLAGMESRPSNFLEIKKGVINLAMLNSLIPFSVGILIGFYLGYSWQAAILLGAVFISSSISAIVPSLTYHQVLDKPLGKTILSATMISDIASLIILSLVLQNFQPISSVPLPLFYAGGIISLIGLRLIIPKVQKLLLPKMFFWFRGAKKADVFQQELRLVLVMLMGTVIIFEILGLHPIIAGFFAGFILSETISSEKLQEKLRVIGYSVFIPIFFVVIGSKTDLSVLFNLNGALLITVLITLGSMVSKFGSGWVGSRLGGFNNIQSLVIGSATIPQLTTTLAVVFTGYELGFFDAKIVAAMMVLSMTTTLLSPILFGFFTNRLKQKDLSLLKSNT